MIGQIVNCPKCNSMLQITGPSSSGINSPGPNSGPVPPGIQSSGQRQIRVESHRGVIDSSAMTKESFAPELEDEYRLAPTPAEPEFDSPAALIAPPRVDHEPNVEDLLNAPPLPDRRLASVSTTDSNAIQLLAVRRTARRRQVLMVAVLGSSGVLFAGMLFTGFLYWYTSKSDSTIARNPGNIDQSVTVQKHVGPKPEHEPNGASDTLAEPDADPLDEPTVSPVAPDLNANQPLESELTERSNSIGSENANPNATQSDAAAPDLAAKPEQPVVPNEADPDQPATELPDQLKKFQSILETAIEPQFLEDQAIQKAPPTAEELGLTSGADSKAIAVVDVEKQMQLALTGLIIPPGTVSSAVSQWVQVSGVPTVVDLDSFAAAGIDPYKPMAKILVSSEQPLAQVGAAIAKEMGVEIKTFENRFLAFQASDSAVQQQMPTSINISDLITDTDQQQWFVKTLDQIWPEYEGKWIVRDGELTVDPVVVDALAWFWAVRMLETWRLVAGIETQLDKSKFDQAKFAAKFVDPDQLEVLNKPLSLKLINRAPVAQLVSEMCAANQMHAWVDWASVGQRGLGPNTIDFVVTHDRTLRQCLRDLAEKYSLVVALEDDKSVLITTPEVYRVQPRLYVLPSQGKTAEQWMEELQPLTPGTATVVQPIQAFLTPDSRYVIVRCCRPSLRN